MRLAGHQFGRLTQFSVLRPRDSSGWERGVEMDLATDTFVKRRVRRAVSNHAAVRSVKLGVLPLDSVRLPFD